MNGMRYGGSRRAFASTIAVLTAIVVLMIVVVLGRAVVQERTGGRLAVLAAQADEVLWSARDWSRIHVQALTTSDPIELPVADLLTTTATGRLELRRVDTGDGRERVECCLRLTHGPQTIMRCARWPLSGPSE